MVSRPWLALILVCFCLPLYVGLGRADLRGDEAGHSFSVDRILEIGDWLAPKSSPGENAVFLEKPPLKFWMVAAPIKLGLLPHDEFGLRFWDPLLAGIAFLYVFAMGSVLAGPLAGGVAVLILFVHQPLLFDHGIRGNNMEAALLLCYCGALYHFQTWAQLTPSPREEREDKGALRTSNRRAALHAAAVAVYFALGFMTKFVAAAFVPIVIGACTLLFADWRAKVFHHLRVWIGAGALAAALILPWFAYAHARFGTELWDTMFGAHVYQRFTVGLDPTHLHPWSWYFTTMFQQFVDSQTVLWVAGGFLLLLVMTIRRRWPEGGLVLIWFGLPLGLISMGTSKLYHYAYPFLPPAALAGGYLAGMAFLLLPAPIVGGLTWLRTWLEARLPGVFAACATPRARAIVKTVGLVAAIIGLASVTYGPLRFVIKGIVVKSSGPLRPSVIVLLAALLAGSLLNAARVVVLLTVLSFLPAPMYWNVWARFNTGEHPMATARDCVKRVEADLARTTGARGLYVDGLNYGFGHEHYYYFRTIRPTEFAPQPSPGRIYELLHAPNPRPMLVTDTIYRDYMHGVDRPPNAPPELDPVPVRSFTDVVLLLPGPYATCSSESASHPQVQ